MENKVAQREWFEYTDKDLKDLDKCKEVFKHMLRVLENDGNCREVYHRLAFELFLDDME